MSSLEAVGTPAACDEVAKKMNNEIKFETFVIQAKKNHVLVLKDETKERIVTKPGVLFGTILYNANDPSVKERVLIDSYLDLYDYLIKKNIITSKVGSESCCTRDHVNVVNPQLSDVTNLQNLLKERNLYYPNSLKCYTLHHDRLSHMLQLYSPEDTVKLHSPKTITHHETNIEEQFKTGLNLYKIQNQRLELIYEKKDVELELELVQIEPITIGFPKGGKNKTKNKNRNKTKTKKRNRRNIKTI